ncbi:MAG: hypothetical protein MJ159_05355 [Treponemataceae bacterium]|nr:hypothetical protein [Treponemataceae bacterium]
MKKSILFLTIIACITLLFSACSGGGGGSTSTNPVEQALSIDLFNNRTWKNSAGQELVFNSKKLTVKYGSNNIAVDKSYTLTNLDDLGRTGIFKSEALGNQEMTFNFDRNVNPTKVTFRYGSITETYQKQ